MTAFVETKGYHFNKSACPGDYKAGEGFFWCQHCGEKTPQDQSSTYFQDVGYMNIIICRRCYEKKEGLV